MDREEPLLKASVEGPTIAQRHGAKGVTVVGAGESGDTGAAGLTDQLPVLERELEGDLDGVGAVVREEAAIERTARQAGKLLGELGGARVVEAEEGDVGDLVELGAEGGVELGVVVSMDIGPDGGVSIEVATPFGVP